MKTVFINLVSFKVGWAASVAAAAASVPAAGAAVAIAVIAFHLLRAERRRPEFKLLIAAALMGVVWESALVATGLLRYEAGFLVPGFAPYWIVAMWVLFATTLNVGMRWLRKSTWVAAVAGALGGPLAFVTGERMGAVSFSEPTLALAIIGIGWATLLPLLVRLAILFEGEARTPVGAGTAPVIAETKGELS